jgi:hypothetical protein
VVSKGFARHDTHSNGVSPFACNTSLQFKFLTSAFILTPAPCKHWSFYEGEELLQKLKREEKYNKVGFLARLHLNRGFARNVSEYVCHSPLPIIINTVVFACVSFQQTMDLRVRSTSLSHRCRCARERRGFAIHSDVNIVHKQCSLRCGGAFRISYKHVRILIIQGVDGGLFGRKSVKTFAKTHIHIHFLGGEGSS